MRRLFILLFVLAGCLPLANENPTLPTLAPLPEEVFALFPWETETGQLSTAGDVIFYHLGGEVGDNIFIRTVSRGVSTRLTLLLNDNIVAEGTNVLELTLPVSDSYRVRVDYVSGAGEFDIGLGYSNQQNPNDIQASPIPQLVGVPTPTPPFNSLGEFIDGLTESREYAELLTADSPQHVYIIQGQPGMIVNFELYRIAGTFDPVLRFYDNDGNLMAMDDNSLGNNNARLLNLRLPEAGLYSVQVDGKGLYGDYTLVYLDEAIILEPDQHPTAEPTMVIPYETPAIRFAAPDQRLEDHRPAINSIIREGDFQRFSFFADAGERVSIVVEPMAGSDIIPQFEVFDIDGSQIAFTSATESNANGAAVVNGIIIGQTGAYTIIVTAESNTIGQFLISFGRGASVRDDYKGFAFSNSRIGANIDVVGSRHIWELDLNPGDVVSIAVSPEEVALNPVIELVTVSGDVIYRDDDGGAGNAALIQLAEINSPATYLLRVYDETGTNTGSYTLLWNYVNIAPTPTPIPSLATILSANGDISEGQYQFYAFQGLAGQRILIEVNAESGSTLDPVMALLNPDGTIILEADDSDNSLNPRSIITLPTDGVYRVRVNGYLSSGEFTLIVALLFD